MNPKRLLCILALAASPMAVSAGLIGDEVNATVDGAFGTVISGLATVGPGVEFTGTDSLLRDYTLNLTDLAFALTVSKDSSAGNFTAILDSIVIEGIDQEVLGVTFDARACAGHRQRDCRGGTGRFLLGLGQRSRAAGRTHEAVAAHVGPVAESLSGALTRAGRLARPQAPTARRAAHRRHHRAMANWDAVRSARPGTVH